MTIQEAAQQALDVQDACNLSGIVFSFAKIMQVICDEATRRGEGTDWKNQHPITVLFVDKLAQLAGVGTFHAAPHAYEACKKLAAGAPSKEVY